MKLGIGHIMYLLALLLTAVSCSNDGFVDDTPVADKEQVQITFTINMGGSTKSTRATWGDNLDSDENNNYKQETGTTDENFIEEGKLQVLLFKTDDTNTFLGELENVRYNRHSDKDNIYDIVGSLSVDKATVVDGKLECKIVVLANYDTKASLSSGDNISSIKDLSFNYDTKYIPMFGVETYSGDNAIKLSAGSWSDIGEIYMLRAMAKIRVKCSSEDINITDISVSNYNTLGYIVPKGYTEKSTKDIDYNTLNANSTIIEDENLSFFDNTEVDDDKQTYWYVYLPEIGSGNEPKITVEYTTIDDKTTTHERSFKIGEYTKGKFTEGINIVRNHIYTFSLNYTGEEVEINTLKYQAMEWDSKWAVIGFE